MEGAFRGGAAAVVRFVHSGGTTTFLSYRELSLSQGGNLIDTTAGNDAAETHIKGIANWSLPIGYVHRGNTSSVGTADIAALIFGAAGTVYMSPQGTATGSQYFYGAASVESHELSVPYDGEVTGNVTFKGNGALSIGHW